MRYGANIAIFDKIRYIVPTLAASQTKLNHQLLHHSHY